MAAVTCKYHTQIPARWSCDHCRINFCPGCVKSVKSGDAPACPVCKQPLSSVGSGNMIKPFWLRLGQFFLFPLHAGPLILMIIFSLLGFAIYMTPIPGILLIPLGFMFLKYCHVVLEDTAHGYLKPRTITSEVLSENMEMPFKLILLVFAYSFLIFTAMDIFGMFGYYAALIFVALVLPAAIAALSIEHSFFQAFNPLIVVTVISRIGLPYFIMFALLYFLVEAAFAVFNFLPDIIDPPFSSIFFYFFVMYFMLMMFNMLGYILYQYHEELGFAIDVEAHEHDEKLKDEAVTVSPELRTIEILIQEGKTDDAVKQLEIHVLNNPMDIEARDRLLKLLRLTGNMEKHKKQGQNYISYLFHENKTAQAARVYESCVEYDRAFRPAKAPERIELAKFLRQNGKHKLALAILNNLHVDFPTYDGVPEAYLIVAQLLCEQFNEDVRAGQVLEFILKNYPNHSLNNEVRGYLEIVNNISRA